VKNQKQKTKSKRPAKQYAKRKKQSFLAQYRPALVIIATVLVLGVWAIGHYFVDQTHKQSESPVRPAVAVKPEKKAPPVPVAVPLEKQKVAIIGDSQFTQNDTGASAVPAAFASKGWKPENIWLYAALAKGMNDPDVNGLTTVQNIEAARAGLGGEPDLWVFNLGGNGNDAPDESTIASLDAIFAALGPNAKVLWTNIARYNPADTHVNRRNTVVAQYLANNPNVRLFDWASYVHTLDESAFWNPDGIHMTTDPGYTVRNQHTAEQAAIYALELKR
jgi:hypothetical protein